MVQLLGAGAPLVPHAFPVAAEGSVLASGATLRRHPLTTLVMRAAKRVVLGSGDAVGIAAWPGTLTPGGLTYPPGHSEEFCRPRGGPPAGPLTIWTHGWKTLRGPSWGFTGLRGVSWDSDFDDYLDRREADCLDHLVRGAVESHPGRLGPLLGNLYGVAQRLPATPGPCSGSSAFRPAAGHDA